MSSHVTVHELPGRILAIYCGHCAGALRLALPMPVAEFVAAAQQYAKRHATCQAREEPRGDF